MSNPSLDKLYIDSVEDFNEPEEEDDEYDFEKIYEKELATDLDKRRRNNHKITGNDKMKILNQEHLEDEELDELMIGKEY